MEVDFPLGPAEVAARLVDGLLERGFIIDPLRPGGRRRLVTIENPIDMRAFVAIQMAVTEAYPALGEQPAGDVYQTVDLPGGGQLIHLTIDES